MTPGICQELVPVHKIDTGVFYLREEKCILVLNNYNQIV